METTARFATEPVTRWGPAEFDQLLLWSMSGGASDVKLSPNGPVWNRRNGAWLPVSRRPLRSEEIEQMLVHLANNPSSVQVVRDRRDYDFAYEVRVSESDRRRFRGNATSVRDGYISGIEVTLRAIQSTPPTVADIKFPAELIEPATPNNGLVLVTGVMGSGKSTTLAALLRHINETSPRAIATYEEPVEYILTGLQNAMGPVAQTEIPKDLASFSLAARNATRRAEDVILVGESRDPETLSTMIEVAEIGSAVYSTVHTRSVAATPLRIINVFPADRQNQIAASLISALRLIIQQRLVPGIDPQTGQRSGRIALREFLEFDTAMRETLIICPINTLVPEIEKRVFSYGHPLVKDAQVYYEQGRLSEEEFRKIEREYRRKTDVA